jgi:hypothetical protein
MVLGLAAIKLLELAGDALGWDELVANYLGGLTFFAIMTVHYRRFKARHPRRKPAPGEPSAG